MAKVTLEITSRELTLLYLMSGNEDAGRIVRQCIAEERAFNARLNPPTKPARSRRSLTEPDKSLPKPSTSGEQQT